MERFLSQEYNFAGPDPKLDKEVFALLAMGKNDYKGKFSWGFPVECFLPQEYDFAGPDPKLDMVVALLAMGKNNYKR
jgi:hypothetical protein